MSTNAGVARDRLPAYVSGSRAVGWWGIVLLILIESIVFASLILTYYYLKVYAPEWPLGGIEKPKLLLPTIGATLLLGSIAPMYWAESGIRRGQKRRLRIGLAICLVMGAVFMVLKVVEYSGVDYTWSTNAYGSVVWTIVGFHSGHVIALLLKTAAIGVLAWQGYFDERRHVAVQGNALYWYFVAGVWVPLYATLYLSPRLL